MILESKNNFKIFNTIQGPQKKTKILESFTGMYIHKVR